MEDMYSTHLNPYFQDKKLSLQPLPYPVYFVTKDPKWQDVISNPELPLDEKLYERCITGHDIWSGQTYLSLKQRGLNIHLASELVPGEICVVPYYYIQPRDRPYKSYVVACQFDTPHPELCEQCIVINESRVLDRNHHFLNHWPQPNLKPRDPARGTKVENLVFKGHAYNLAEPFRTSEFIAELQTLGINLVISSDNDESKFAEWRDYTNADVALAVRDITTFDVALKPALKLINTWFSGCPAILGPEPAYQALRQSELDYIEVREPGEVIAALKRLQENPKLYSAMVENGFHRAAAFTTNCVAQQWRDLLAGPIAAGYEQWLKRSTSEKFMAQTLQFAWRVFNHKREQRRYKNGIHSGPRILSGTQSR